MNAKDRKTVESVIAELEGLQVQVKELADAEREKYENMSEGLQQSDNGTKIDEAATALEDAADNLESVVTALNEAIGG